jgi:uncharacterized membrane protein
MRNSLPSAALALCLFLVSVAMTAYGFVSLVAPGTELIPNRPSLIDFLTFGLTFIAFPSVGLLVAWKRPANPIGWLFLVIGLGVSASVASGEYADRYLHVGTDLPAVEIVAWVGTWSWMVTMGLALTFAVLLFPTGRLPDRRWLPVAWLSAVTIAATATAEALRPGPLSDYEQSGLQRPVALGGALGELMQAVADAGLLAVVLLGILSIASLVYRFRRAQGTERQQLKWFLYPAVLFLVGLVAASVLQTPSAWSVALLGLAAIPVGAGIAILRHGLFDIDLVINRTLVYGSLTVLLGGVYIGSVLGLQALITPIFGTDTVAVAASTLAVAALFGPARQRVQAAVNRRFYRSRYDAQRTLEAFSGRLRDEVDPEHLTDELRAATEATLRPSSAWVWLRNG